VKTLTDVLDNALRGPGKKDLIKKLSNLQSIVTDKVELESEKKYRKIPTRGVSAQEEHE